jgi:hypothetical protein
VNNIEGIPELAQQAIERLKGKKEEALEVPAYQTNEMAEYGGSPAEIQPELDALNQEANYVVQSTEEKIHNVETGASEQSELEQEGVQNTVERKTPTQEFDEFISNSANYTKLVNDVELFQKIRDSVGSE